MKSLLAVIILISSMSANAADNSKECGINVDQVQQIIDEHKRDWKLPDDWAAKFVGVWGEDGRIRVEEKGQAFTYKGYRFMACPQKDGAMLLVSLDDPSKTAMIRRHNQNLLVISGYAGMGAAAVNGAYPRQGVTMTATGRGGRSF